VVSATRTRVRQKAKGPIAPEFGARVRELRTARAMTQAQLAGEDFTKGFISLVETGRTRMSLRAAEIIAARLGVPVVALLATPGSSDQQRAELAVLRAEAELAAGNPQRALQLTENVEQHSSGVLRARAQRLRGRALNEASKSRDAIRLLDEALRTFRDARERELVVRTTYDLAVAHGRLDEHAESLNLALECERALRNGELVDRTLELQVLAYIAAKLVELGDFASADLRAERARALAEDIADPRALGTLYESLAATREQQGDLDGALRFARKAMEAHRQLGNEASVALSWNTIGWVLQRRGSFSRSAEALQRAERMATEQGDGRLQAYVLQTRAELELARGRFDAAMELAEASIAHPQASERCRALSKLIRAESLAKGDAPLGKVNRAFVEAIDALEPFGRRQVARAYRALFDVLTARGQLRDANVAAQKALAFSQPAIS